MITPVNIEADDLSTAWLATVLSVRASPGHTAFHTVTRIRDTSISEQPRIRKAADDLLDEFGLQPVSTVANTIFPAGLAAQEADASSLSERYIKLYPELKKIRPQKNSKGTYFLRIVSYDNAVGKVNQLVHVIETLRKEIASGGGAKRARYEITLEQQDSFALPVFDPTHDTSAMAFPCLSFLSFQIDKTRLHVVAHYRSQFLVERGYGNYLGIVNLLHYIAKQAGLTPGSATIVVGLAHVDRLRTSLVSDLKALSDDLRR